ncbi:MAG TPA: hypothetical protein VHM19_11860, partial [Polyangiales bacterium]|nr:hypothetical protein [Polyangiales bacterium]
MATKRKATTSKPQKAAKKPARKPAHGASHGASSKSSKESDADARTRKLALVIAEAGLEHKAL